MVDCIAIQNFLVTNDQFGHVIQPPVFLGMRYRQWMLTTWTTFAREMRPDTLCEAYEKYDRICGHFPESQRVLDNLRQVYLTNNDTMTVLEHMCKGFSMTNDELAQCTVSIKRKNKPKKIGEKKVRRDKVGDAGKKGGRKKKDKTREEDEKQKKKRKKELRKKMLEIATKGTIPKHKCPVD